MALSKGRVDIALVHYPVYNKNRQVISSAVTNLDLHDLARAARTYGVGTVFIITPIKDQQKLVEEIVGHWQDGYGASYNPDRKDALAVVKICSDLQEAAKLVAEQGEYTLVATAAQAQGEVLSHSSARQRIQSGENFLLLFGTAWGLTEEVFSNVDGVLAPIKGSGEYNHLSVRSAVAIMLDKLLGEV